MLNEKLRDAFLRHNLEGVEYSGVLFQHLAAHLNDTRDGIFATFASLPLHDVEVPMKHAMVAQAVRNAFSARTVAWTNVERELTRSALGHAEASAQAFMSAFHGLSRHGLDARVAAFTYDLNIHGFTLGKWLQRVQEDENRRILTVATAQVVQNATSVGIARAVVGSSSKKYSDGVFAASERALKTLTRSAIMGAIATARQAFVEQNSHLFKSEQFISFSNTDTQCSKIKDAIFALGEGPQPPLHFGCQSARVPILSTKFFPEEKVPHTPSYHVWLENQPISFQDEMLGRRQGVKFRQGALKVSHYKSRR